MALTKVTGQVIKNTTDVTVGVLTVTNTLAVGGTVSIGGTLTYEDVTNVDAVGLITARNGIVVGSGITLSKDGDGFFTGVTTATTFVGALTGNVTGNISGGTVAGSTGTFSGAVSGTTGTFTGDVDIAETIVHTGDADTKIKFPSADTITAETGGTERLRIASGGKIGLNQSSPYAELDITSSVEDTTTGALSAHGIRLAAVGATDEQVIPITAGFRTQQDRARAGIGFISKQASGTDGLAGAIGFYTRSSADGNVLKTTDEKVRIASDGKVGINSTSPSNLFTIESTDNNQFAIKSDDTNADIVLADTGGSARIRHTDTKFEIWTGGAAGSSYAQSSARRLTIDSSGNVLIGDSAGQIGKLSTLGTGNHISAIRHSTDTSSANFLFAKYRGSRSSPAIIVNGDTLGDLAWYGYNGSSIIKAASISAAADSTVDASNMPTKLVFKTTSGNTNRSVMEISNHGHVRKPNQPYFHVYGAGGATAYNQNSVVVLTQVSVNTGSNYDTSNGRFTVPAGAAGIYMFTFQFFPNSADTFRVALRRNGTNQTNGYISGHNSGMGAGMSAVSGCMMLSLSEADYVDIVIANGDMSNTYNGHTGFQGYFLG